MRKYLLATHGTFSSGIKTSLDLIIGEMEHVFIINAYADGNRSIEDELHTVLTHVQPEDELIIFTDLIGGSVTNQVLRYALRENTHVVSGMNLPLLIDVMLAPAETPVEEVIETAINNAKGQLVYVNKLIPKENDHD
jgi:mannose/fructose-specific phosphotransferase system component IIA